MTKRCTDPRLLYFTLRNTESDNRIKDSGSRKEMLLGYVTEMLRKDSVNGLNM